MALGNQSYFLKYKLGVATWDKKVMGLSVFAMFCFMPQIAQMSTDKRSLYL
jgi:hypothetical protein